jgi:hypothetical protein
MPCDVEAGGVGGAEAPASCEARRRADAAGNVNFNIVGTGMDGTLLAVDGDFDRIGGRVGEVLIGGAQVGLWQQRRVSLVSLAASFSPSSRHSVHTRWRGAIWGTRSSPAPSFSRRRQIGPGRVGRAVETRENGNRASGRGEGLLLIIQRVGSDLEISDGGSGLGGRRQRRKLCWR